MKTDVSSQAEPRTRLERLLDALRIQEELLQNLAVQATDHCERRSPGQGAPAGDVPAVTFARFGPDLPVRRQSRF
jgi:hypothetical protein